MYQIRKAEEKDIPFVAEIYEHILTEEENGRASVGWVRGVYPTKDTAKEAQREGDLFVLEEEGCIRAAARINQVQVPEYRYAAWEFPDVPEKSVMVLHTLVVEPSAGGHGYGTAFVSFYESYAMQAGCPYLRMDTNQKNHAARRLYAKLGYQEADIVDCNFNGISGVKLVCLEKRLKSDKIESK